MRAPRRAPPCPRKSPPPANAKSWARARARLDALTLAERLAADGLSRTEADASAAQTVGVTANALQRWRRRCRNLPPEQRLAALIDRPGRGRRDRLTGTEMADCVEALIYEHAPHLTASHVVRVLAARHGKAPSLRAVQRWLKKWREDPTNAALCAPPPT